MFLDQWHEFSGSMDRRRARQVGYSSFALSCRLLRKRLANACDVNLFACVRHLAGRPLDSSALGMVPPSTAEVFHRNIRWVKWDSRLGRQMERPCTSILITCRLQTCRSVAGRFPGGFDVDQPLSRTGLRSTKSDCDVPRHLDPKGVLR